jgi:hypothetical protein
MIVIKTIFFVLTNYQTARIGGSYVLERNGM